MADDLPGRSGQPSLREPSAVGGSRRTDKQRAGDEAERLVANSLMARGWSVLARNLHFGRSELDILAVDPGPPARLVVVEVRYRSSRSFGLAEETFDHRKRGQLRLGIARMIETGCLPDRSALPHLPIAVDLAIVERGPNDRLTARLYRNALA